MVFVRKTLVSFDDNNIYIESVLFFLDFWKAHDDDGVLRSITLKFLILLFFEKPCPCAFKQQNKTKQKHDPLYTVYTVV